MNGSDREQDYRLLIGTQPFDPKKVATHSRQRIAADARELSRRDVAARETTIVQFTSALTGSDAARLEAAYGLKFGRYIPNLAYLERLTAETVARLRDDFLVRVCIALDPALKLAPWIGGAGGQPTPGAPLELTATLFDDADINAVESALSAIGARDIHIVDDRPIGGRPHVRFVLDDPARLAPIAAANDCLEVEAIRFETWIVDKQKKESRPSGPQEGYELSRELLAMQARFGAAGVSDLRRSGRAKYRTSRIGHQLVREGWSVVATDNLTVQPVPGIEAGTPTIYSEAAQALRKLKRDNPVRAAGLRILRLSEVRIMA
jgi:hypothetical protein